MKLHAPSARDVMHAPVALRSLPLRERLAVSFALALFIAYALIACCAVAIVDRAVTRSIDGRLSTVAQAISAIAGDEKDEIDRKDRQQFASITADAGGAFVIAADGSRVLGTAEELPVWIPGVLKTAQSGRQFSAQQHGHALRAIVVRRQLHHTANAIVVWQSLQIVQELERVVGLVLGGFGVAVGAAGYLVGAQIARRGLLPLTRIAAVVADIAAHDLSRRVGPQRHLDEVGRLAATFDRMLDRLQAAFERQRRFTADASHDLRAPLATLRAEVDLALRRERTNAEYHSALVEIAADADQLDRLIDALLAVARTDAGDVTLHVIDLSALARNAVHGIAPLARAKLVWIATDLPPDARIMGDRDLLARAILATLHNAVTYSPPNGSIHIGVTAQTAGTTLSIRDEGPGFSSGALVHAFDRFWRDDPARGRSGSGLGLAIAQSIVQRCGGDIAIGNAPAGGAKVLMTFPAIPAFAGGAIGDDVSGRRRSTKTV